MKYVYLDQNKWILLARGWYEGKGEIFDLVLDLRKKVANGSLMFVISLVNVMETMTFPDELRRNKLWDFMIDLSQGNAISPFRDWIIKFEIENMFLKRKGAEVDLRPIVIKKGISGIIGAIPSIKGNIPEDLRKKMIEEVNSVETMKKLLSSPEAVQREMSSKIELSAMTKKFEEVRRKERFHKDKAVQYKIVLARYFEDFIFDKMALVGAQGNFPKDFIFKEGMNFKDVIAIFQELPASYTYFSLMNARDRDLDKNIEENDLNDLFSFTMGIAYCDVLFGEKRFVALAKQAKLERTYNRTITSSLR